VSNIRSLSPNRARTLKFAAIASLWSSEMRVFRRDARFQALAEQLHLIDYWRRSGLPEECRLAESKLLCD